MRICTGLIFAYWGRLPGPDPPYRLQSSLEGRTATHSPIVVVPTPDLNGANWLMTFSKANIR